MGVLQFFIFNFFTEKLFIYLCFEENKIVPTYKRMIAKREPAVFDGVTFKFYLFASYAKSNEHFAESGNADKLS